MDAIFVGKERAFQQMCSRYLVDPLERIALLASALHAGVGLALRH